MEMSKRWHGIFKILKMCPPPPPHTHFMKASKARENRLKQIINVALINFTGSSMLLSLILQDHQCCYHYISFIWYWPSFPQWLTAVYMHACIHATTLNFSPSVMSSHFYTDLEKWEYYTSGKAPSLPYSNVITPKYHSYLKAMAEIRIK